VLVVAVAVAVVVVIAAVVVIVEYACHLCLSLQMLEAEEVHNAFVKRNREVEEMGAHAAINKMGKFLRQ